MKTYFITTLLSIFLAVPTSAESPLSLGVTTQGEGVVNAAPDLVSILLSVNTENPKAVVAMNENNLAMAKLLETVKEFGVEKKDVKTSSFNINPTYAYPTNQKPKLVGYIVSNEIEVVVRKIAIAGNLLDALVRDGANRVSSVSFGFTDPKALLDKAREEAVKDAKRRAEIMAKAGGATLGALLSVEENTFQTPPRRMFAAESAMRIAGSVPLEAGEIGLKVNVTALWSLH